MATVLENLESARDNAVEKLAAALTGDYSSALEFKPGASGANTLDRATYIRELRATIDFLNNQIAAYDVFDVTSEMTA